MNLFFINKKKASWSTKHTTNYWFRLVKGFDQNKWTKMHRWPVLIFISFQYLCTCIHTNCMDKLPCWIFPIYRDTLTYLWKHWMNLKSIDIFVKILNELKIKIMGQFMGHGLTHFRRSYDKITWFKRIG